MFHKISELYKNIYLLSRRLPKGDKLGIFAKIENNCLELFEQTIAAAFETKGMKLPTLSRARIKIETLKRLVRIGAELKIVQQKDYLALESQLQEISKMTNGWIKYAQ